MHSGIGHGHLSLPLAMTLGGLGLGAATSSFSGATSSFGEEVVVPVSGVDVASGWDECSSGVTGREGSLTMGGLRRVGAPRSKRHLLGYIG